MIQANGRVTAPANSLLAALGEREFAEFKSCFVRVPLVRSQVLASHGQPVDHAYFVEQGVVSVVSEDVDDESGIQVAMIGREGAIGDVSFVGMRRPAFARTVVHIPGSALRITGQDLQRVLDACPALQAACAQFVQSLINQVIQNAAFNARRSLMERCARWLVMTHERIDGNELWVTHENLSAMLGMRRSGVTVAAAALQQAGLISTGRGRLTVLDRDGLDGVARGEKPEPAAARRLDSRIDVGRARPEHRDYA